MFYLIIFLFQKARLMVIDTQAAKIQNVLEIVNNAGDDLDILEVKLNKNSEFLVAYVLLKFDTESYKNSCYYFVWDRSDYSKKPFKTKWFQCREAIFDQIISNILLDIPVISEDGNLLIDEAKRYTINPDVTCKELDLTTKSETTKVITSLDFKSIVFNYRHKHAMVCIQLVFPQEPGGDYKYLPFKTLIFRSKDRILWKKNFPRKVQIIGWCENYVAISTRIPRENTGVVTVYRLTDGNPVSKFTLGTEELLLNEDDFPLSVKLIQKQRSEIEVQFSRNRIACKGHIQQSSEEHPPFDLYILDFATGKVMLECNRDLNLQDVKKFLLTESSLVLEHDNKILLIKFWL